MIRAEMPRDAERAMPRSAHRMMPSLLLISFCYDMHGRHIAMPAGVVVASADAPFQRYALLLTDAAADDFEVLP